MKTYLEELFKNKRFQFFALVILILLAVVIIFLIIVNKEKSPVFQGYGSEVDNLLLNPVSYSAEEIEESERKIKATPNGDPIRSVQSINTNLKTEFLENPRRYKYATSDSNKFIEIIIKDNLADFHLKSNDGLINEYSVISGIWDLTEQYFLFTKGEMTNEDFANKNNIWVLKYGENKATKIFSTDDVNSINKVSNGTIVAFTTKNKVGVINIDGTNLKYIYEFKEEPTMQPEDIYAPEIQVFNEFEFVVTLKTPEFFIDGSEEHLIFEFTGERIQ